MRRFLSISLCLFLVAASASAAGIPPIGRRSFIRAVSLCVAATLVRVDALSPARHRWSMHPESNIETLGLESFGNSVKELLGIEAGIADPKIAEAIRWKLQDSVWKRLEPKEELVRPARANLVVAIHLPDDRYIYLNPRFRVDPLTPAEAATRERTVGKIEYLSDTNDFRVLTYWFGRAPEDRETVVVVATQMIR
jgi:hypothetical protein